MFQSRVLSITSLCPCCPVRAARNTYCRLFDRDLPILTQTLEPDMQQREASQIAKLTPGVEQIPSDPCQRLEARMMLRRCHSRPKAQGRRVHWEDLSKICTLQEHAHLACCLCCSLLARSDDWRASGLDLNFLHVSLSIRRRTTSGAPPLQRSGHHAFYSPRTFEHLLD